MLPQVLSSFASYTLLRFEINVRSAAVMGFVGAGGIGQDLMEAIRKFYYSDVSAILLLIIITVMVIDLLTERLRHRLDRAGAAVMSGRLRDAALGDLDGLRASASRSLPHARLPARAARSVSLSCSLALALYGFWRLEFSFGRLGSGLGADRPYRRA